MNVTYKHTSITARDWRALATFYETVFGCIRKPPERHLSGEWLERGTGVDGARIEGVHLLLPGCGADGPTMEMFTYTQNEDRMPSEANREGFTHIAFEVDNVEAVLDTMLNHGGGMLGEIVTHEVEGAGLLTFVYATDPEGNIIELQSWS